MSKQQFQIITTLLGLILNMIFAGTIVSAWNNGAAAALAGVLMFAAGLIFSRALK